MNVSRTRAISHRLLRTYRVAPKVGKVWMRRCRRMKEERELSQERDCDKTRLHAGQGATSVSFLARLVSTESQLDNTSMSSTTPAPIALNDDAFAQAESLAWRDGVFAGLSCALVAGAPTRPCWASAR
jgi:hypothetical protein